MHNASGICSLSPCGCTPAQPQQYQHTAAPLEDDALHLLVGTGKFAYHDRQYKPHVVTRVIVLIQRISIGTEPTYCALRLISKYPQR
jgi:hypothetical protein